MSLPYDPQFTKDPTGTGNVYGGATGTTLAASASVTENFAVGAGSQTTSGYPVACQSARLQALCFGGSAVAATNGLQWQIFSSSDGGTTYDSVAYQSGPTIGAVASTTTAASIDLGPGQYQIKLTNLDATNAIKVALTCGTIG